MRDRMTALVWAAAAVMLTLSLVLFPETALESAKGGMNLFLNAVFPSLLPFFILSEIMLGLGVVHFIGVLFTPLMRPLFNVPGEGAFVLSMGLAAGYPMDAVITSRFRKTGMCTRAEGERMLAFSNTADPVLTWLSVRGAREESAPHDWGSALLCYLLGYRAASWPSFRALSSASSSAAEPRSRYIPASSAR